ncbi:MAG: thioredoxin family protein [Bacteroidales bacterium]|nr:thioredoxin family protein [Bacteroidales bacterium]
MADAMLSRLNSMLADSTPVLIEFYADWCPHCRRMMPVVAELRAEIGEAANIVQIEGEEHPEIMDQFGVDSFPTFVLVKDGREMWRDSGEMSLEQLTDTIRQYA